MRCRPICAIRNRSRRRCAMPMSPSIWSAFCSSAAASASMQSTPRARKRWRWRRQSAGARLVHVSAIGADANSPSRYARSKAEGERRVLAAAPQATVMRPSIVFGPEDDFFNRFAALARIAPALPLPGGGHTRYPAGICRRRRRSDRACGRWRHQAGRDLRIRRAGRAHVPRIDGVHPRHHRAPPTSGAGAVRAAEAAGRVRSVPAEAADHARPGGNAQARQCRLRRGAARRTQRSKRSGSSPRRSRRSCRPICGVSARPASSLSATGITVGRRRRADLVKPARRRNPTQVACARLRPSRTLSNFVTES